MKVGYARVSKNDGSQNLEAQLKRLREAGCEKLFSDEASGKLASRPQWDECMSFLRQGDVLVAVRLDRFGRSVANLISVSTELGERGVGIMCLDQAIDTTSAMGELFFTILAAFAQFERSLIVERTRDGLAATEKRGRSGGRKPALKPYQVQHARDEIAKGRLPGEVAAELGVSRSTLYRSINGDHPKAEARP